MINNIDEFSREVIDEIKYYVYRLIDPRNGETFYVEKGKGNRVFNHIKCLQEEKLDNESDKLETIRMINAEGLEVIHVIHRHGMDEETALEVEAALIDAYPGVTNIMGGTGSSEYRPMNALEIVTKYSAEEAELKHKVIMIKINKSLKNRDLYDATRYAWILNRSRAERCEYVLGVHNGIIKGVYRPIKWLKATEENFPGFIKTNPRRIGFIGEEAEDEIKGMYLRKRVPDRYNKKGSQNPCRYNYK